MIQAGDFRKGHTFEMDGGVWTIIEFQHVKPGKGAAFVRTKIRNVLSGGTLEKTFNPVEKFQKANIENLKLQYLYTDGELYYFMDTETFEQTALNEKSVEDSLKYIKENDMVSIRFFNGQPFSVEPENFVTMRIIQADPGVPGNTATNALKNAVIETGATVQVPMFVNEGELIRIDTRTGDYMERVKG